MNMKSKTIIGLLFSLLLFTACSNNNGTNVNTPTIDPVGGPVVTAQPTPTAEIKQGRQLTIEELDRVNRLIDYNQKDGNYITAFLSMYRSFKSKNEIKIDSIISSLRAGEDMLTDDDVEEIADLKAEGLNIFFDDIELDNKKYYKHTYDKVNNILYKYTGLTIDQLGEEGMEDAVYCLMV